jgi:hypothetical protein
VSYQDPVSLVTADLLLHRIEAELVGCRSILAKIEYAVETLLQSGNVPQDDPLHIVEMQNIDLMDQILADLVICLQDLTAARSVDGTVPLRIAHVTRRMRLADLRDRLAGLTNAVRDGDGVELF